MSRNTEYEQLRWESIYKKVRRVIQIPKTSLIKSMKAFNKNEDRKKLHMLLKKVERGGELD